MTTVYDFGPYHPLDSIFSPKSIAVIGASETAGSIGRVVMQNLLDGFKGKLYPVNPKHAKIFDLPCYHHLKDLKNETNELDLALIATPAPSVPQVISDCVEAGVKSAVILSAGFVERGAVGAELEKQLIECAQGKLRLLGPNSLGIMRPAHGLNASLAATKALPGRVAFISQSGAFCNAVLDWSKQENVGFSAFISIGGMLDVSWGDLIEYLGDDMQTKSIVMYMEHIGQVRAFLTAAREVALTKPIIVIKGGRTQQAAKAAASHTGMLAGNDEVLDAAFRRVGVLRVNRIWELFYMAEALGKQPRPIGNRLTIISNAGGPAVLATDMLIGEGGQLAPLSEELIQELDQVLPPYWSRNNPLDILGDADAARYAKAFEIAAKNPNSDGTLVILTPQLNTEPIQTAQKLIEHAKTSRKPILASWMGGATVAEGNQLLNAANIPTFIYPDTAATLFNYMWKYDYNLRGIYETPMLEEQSATKATQAREIIEQATQAGRTILSELESKQILEAYSIPVCPTHLAISPEEAVTIAKELGFPVVLKLHSHTITHKHAMGGVKLNLADEAAVLQAYNEIAATQSGRGDPRGSPDKATFSGVTVQPMVTWRGHEVLIGSKIDTEFGAVLMFGGGGSLVEVYKDYTVALPPLTSTLARRLMERTKIFGALQGDIGELEQILVRFSYLVAEQPRIKEIDINPLLVSPAGLVALDARVILHDPSLSDAQLPKTAIAPYPKQYVQSWTLKDGSPILIRPIRPEDEPMMRRFHETLSDRSVYFRYLHPIKLSQRVSHERLTRICFIDYAREMALIAVQTNPATGESEIRGVGRLIKISGTSDGEFALLIADQMQGQGLGTELLRRLIMVGRDYGFDRIVGDMHPENQAVQHVSKKLNFTVKYSLEDQLVKANLELD